MNELEADFKEVLIVGPGLLGASLGLALQRLYPNIHIKGLARRDETLKEAQSRGCIHHGYQAIEDAVPGSDLIILCTPVQTIINQLDQIAELADSECIITDVGSTKSSIVQKANETLKPNQYFVGSHPMAGCEKQGPEAADINLFDGKPVIISATDQTNPIAIEKIKRLWLALKMRIIELSPEDHDAAVATVSHIPHLASVALVDIANDEQLPVASTGFAGQTRLAAGNADLWADILFENPSHVCQSLNQLSNICLEYQALIHAGDRETLVNRLKQAAQRRAEWSKAFGVKDEV